MTRDSDAAQFCDRSLPHTERRALFGGKGTVRVWALTASPALPFTAILSCELDPGGSVGTHVQEHDPEIVLGLSGEGRARVDGEPQRLCAGLVVELALGRTLAIENDSTEVPLRYLIIKAKSALL